MGNTNNTTRNTNGATEDTLRLMVEGENWTEITQLLRERDNAKTEALFVFDLLTSNHSEGEEEYNILLYNIIGEYGNREDKEAFDNKEAVVALISTLVALGGQDLALRITDEYDTKNSNTLLHLVCYIYPTIDVVSQLIEVGGKALVMETDSNGFTSLHVALEKKASNDVVLMLIEVGGKELVLKKNKYGWTALHFALAFEASIGVVLKLIEVGGKELVMEEDILGKTSLRAAVECHASNDVVLKLIEVGGKALVLEKDYYGETSLHRYGNTLLHTAVGSALSTRKEIDDDSIATINHLIQYGGAEILNERMNKSLMTPLESIITKEIDEDDSDEDGDGDEDENGREETFFANCSRAASLLIKRGIELQVEGEYGIGGLLSTSSEKETKEKIYNRWDRVVLPALEQVMAEPHNRQLPILQSMVVNGAPPHIIKSTTKSLPQSANNPDSHGRYPIDFAVRHGLAWNDGMKEILEGSTLDGLERKDTSTGLYPFMLAALGGEENGYDFDSVFHMIKSSAKLVRFYAGN